MANEEVAALETQIAELQAKLARARQASGASTPAADGSAPTTASARAVVVGGNSDGDINTGEQVNIDGHVIGGDYIKIVNRTVHRGENPAIAQSVIAHYLHTLINDLTGLMLGALDVGAGQSDREPLQLADVYVPLNTSLQIPAKLTLPSWFARDRTREIQEADTDREMRHVSVLEALAHHRELTVLGPAGSGKSTFGASVLLALAQAWQGHRGELEGLGSTWTHGALLPIRIVLRRFAEALQKGSAKACAGGLWTFVADDLRDGGVGLSDNTIRYLQDIARDQGALIFFDGLDECGDQTTRADVLTAVEELKRTAGKNCRFLVTARPYAWASGPSIDHGVYSLADLGDEQVERFLSAWYDALARRRWLAFGEAQRKKADLLSVWKRPDLETLARNPFLLTLMAKLHAIEGRLPDDRADLYDASVGLLLLGWNQQVQADQALLAALGIPDLKLQHLRAELEKLAFEIHQESAGSDGAADIGEMRLVRAFGPMLRNSKDKADIVVDYIEKRAGLLIGLGEKNHQRQFAFPHRSFQEYLAACHLAKKKDFESQCVALAQTAPGHWQVVLPLAARIADVDRGASAADALVHGCDPTKLGRRPDPSDWACAKLAGLQLLEIGLGAIRSHERARHVSARVAAWLVASLPVHPSEGGMSAAERAAAGDVLAQLGDPRFDPQHLHLPADDTLGFVHIPADAQFRIGTRRADAPRVTEIIGYEVPENELNDVPTPTSEFYIAQYPVTVGQFRAFVEATQFQLGNHDALADPDNRPVCRVSWHEAIAYCEWLNEQIKTTQAFGGTELADLVRCGGWCVSLPSELEWEKAARGGLSDAVFSWGDDFDAERANCEGAICDTSTVGCYPPNGYGLLDMIGNVLEWMQSRENLSEGSARVLRGGSWIDPRVFARCAYRYRNRPHIRSYLVGFRVVLRPSLFRPSDLRPL